MAMRRIRSTLRHAMMRRFLFLLTFAVLGHPQTIRGQATATIPPDHPERAKAGLKLFRERVRPLLTAHCLECHGGKSIKGDFDLSTREKLLESGYVAATAAESYLVELIEHRSEPAMPFKRPRLADESIALIRQWIDLGAPYDRPLVEGTGEATAAAELVVTDEDRQFWSFRPLARVAPPGLADDHWSRTPVDRFLLARQREVGLTPNGAAERRVLIRRAYFDLLGLPPSPEEVEAFVHDPDPAAWERLVDRLLDSQHYGERWARHWLDVARFAESHGYEQDYDRPHAYHYRDFLIRAFNADLPYDQFVRWQIAGDELAPDDPLALMATGFLGAGSFPTQLTEMEFESARYDELDDMVATLGVAFLGLSTGCARCHDHKFDPIPSRDYYRLAAVFATTIRSEIELDLHPEENARRREEFARRRRQLQDALAHYEQQTLPGEFDQWLAGYDPRSRTASVPSAPSDANAGDQERRPLSAWTLLDGKVASTGTKEFQRLEDGSWLAVGAAPDKEVVTVTAPLPRGAWRALRLEALTHESLPHQGPGRAANGNFALGDVRLSLTRNGAEGSTMTSPVKLALARATHEQDQGSLSVAASIDGDPVSGWAVDRGGIGHDQAAVFDLAEPVVSDGTETLTITLTFQHPNKQHSLGRFRLSVTEVASPPPSVGESGPGADVLTALETLKRSEAVPPSEAAAARRVALEWFRSTRPEWQRLRQALADLERAGDGVVLTKVLVTSEGLPHLPHHADGRGFPHFYPEVHRLQRGDVHQKQEVAQPGYLQVLTSPPRTAEEWRRTPPEGWTRTSFRRAALADWITDVESGAGALLARVIVNRVWQHHFGQGLVATPNDFGFTGERPTHPELLDWLARDLIEQGWRLKRLHKLLMTSSVYLQSGDSDEDRARLDRENKLLWRRAPQRLEAEPIRDAMLAVSGLLDPTMYGPGTLDESMRRRSVYFFIKRSQLIPSMMLFDWPEHLVSIGQRATTTVAPQALMFLNSPHARQYAEAFAGRLEGLDDSAAVDRAYRLALGRAPQEAEQALAVEFLAQQAEVHRAAGASDPWRQARIDFCQALFGMNEFLYIE
jgi:mono/diheme cytochrome c family protein